MAAIMPASLGAFPLPSVRQPLLDPHASLSNYAYHYALANAELAAETEPILWQRALYSVAEPLRQKIEKPGDKGDGIFVERTLLDAFLPLNATISVVRLPPLSHIACSVALSHFRTSYTHSLRRWPS